jgi:predicted O-methyltransferase YrrM
MTDGGSSIPEVQNLLKVLVGSKASGRIAEVGTAFGEGARAIVSALNPDASFVTVEPDPDRYNQAREALAGTQAELINARWQDALPQRAPFDFIFFDGRALDEVGDDALTQAVALLAPGGIVVKDDLTPGSPLAADPMRRALFDDPRLTATEILVTPEMAVVIAVRRP